MKIKETWNVRVKPPNILYPQFQQTTSYTVDISVDYILYSRYISRPHPIQQKYQQTLSYIVDTLVDHILNSRNISRLYPIKQIYSHLSISDCTICIIGCTISIPGCTISLPGCTISIPGCTVLAPCDQHATVLTKNHAVYTLIMICHSFQQFSLLPSAATSCSHGQALF